MFLLCPIAWYALVFAADFFIMTGLGLENGARFALLGLVQFFLGGALILAALRIAGITPSGVGLRTEKLASDIVTGLAIATVFALLQFLWIIPATGGADRSDVVANAAQIGSTYPSLFGMLVLALLGATSEELLFRGLLLGGIATSVGGGIRSKVLVTVIVVALFALGHGYQGWAGIIDTGLYGGLLLSLLYWWRNMRLAAPIAAHVGWNVIAIIMIFAYY